VLFLVRGNNGVLWIQGAEEGTFLIRNDRVQPLGSGGAAVAWKDRSAGSFFRGLSMSIRAVNR
jgi:hypothetical protein